MTVPCMWPEEFEPGWRSRDFAAFKSEKIERRVNPLEMLTPEEREASRERVKNMLERVKREIASSALNAGVRQASRRRMPEPDRHADDVRFAEIDAWARETI